MATAAHPNPIISPVDAAGKWFRDFLYAELTPYPGRAWVVGRVTIAAVITMLLVMTFQIPGGFLGAIFTFFLSRENPIATFTTGAKVMAAVATASVYTVLTLMVLVDDPLTHFAWIALGLFVSFYLLRIVADYGTSVAFGFTFAGAISLWDSSTFPVETRVENTLWLGGVVGVGVVVTVVVEFIFRRIHPASDLNEGIEERLKTVENLMRAAAANQPLPTEWEKRLSLYASVGGSRLRRIVLRSAFSAHYKAQMNTAIALIGLLIDTAANFRLALQERTAPLDAVDRSTCTRIADDLAALCTALMAHQVPPKLERPPTTEARNLPFLTMPFLTMMEQTVAYIPDAFAGSESVQEFVTAPFDEERKPHTFVPDAFSNPEYLKFALRGTLAALVAYMTYTLVAWPGLGTSVATCYITALTTIGSSRQKQILRLGGAIVGGILIGMGSQIFILPWLDTIAGFTILFALVTALASWIATASGRLSYLGVQMALAFYLINLQEFAIQTSLSIARDRIFGVLLGLLSMWLLFDRLWVRNSLDEMESIFAHNLELFADLAEQLLQDDKVAAVRRIRSLRDQINAGFQAVTAQADAVVFEFGPERQRKLQIREDIRRWQPAVRTLLQVQITFAQYRIRKPGAGLPEAIHHADVTFEHELAAVIRAMASEVKGVPVIPVPDIRASAARLQQEIQTYYQQLNQPISAQAEDVMGLTARLASILAPLCEDIRTTFAAHNHSVAVQPAAAQA